MKRGERRVRLTYAPTRWALLANIIGQTHGDYAAYDLDKRVRQDGKVNPDGTITLSCMPYHAAAIRQADAQDRAEAEAPAGEYEWAGLIGGRRRTA